MSYPTAVITGATKGIGKATAYTFLQKGYHIAICARNPEELSALKDEWGQAFPQQQIITQAADFSQKGAVLAFAQTVLAHFTHIDVLVNNAGAFLSGTVLEETDEQLPYMMEVNVMSAYHLSRALIPSMQAKGSGHIVNICSVASLHAYAGGSSYSISKYAMLGLSDNLREACKPYGIAVTAICPGPTESYSWEGTGVDMNRLMAAEDVAATVWQTTQLSRRSCMDRIVLSPIQDL